MSLISHVVVCLEHDTGEMYIDWDSTRVKFEDSIIYNTETETWGDENITKEDYARMSELTDILSAKLGHESKIS